MSVPTVSPSPVVGATDVSVAVPLFSDAEPSETEPIAKATVPEGVPLAAVTVAVRVSVPEPAPSAMLWGETLGEVEVCNGDAADAESENCCTVPVWFSALSVTASVPVTVPEATELKSTIMVQLAPASRL